MFDSYIDWQTKAELVGLIKLTFIGRDIGLLVYSYRLLSLCLHCCPPRLYITTAARDGSRESHIVLSSFVSYLIKPACTAALCFEKVRLHILIKSAIPEQRVWQVIEKGTSISVTLIIECLIINIIF